MTSPAFKTLALATCCYLVTPALSRAQENQEQNMPESGSFVVIRDGWKNVTTCGFDQDKITFAAQITKHFDENESSPEKTYVVGGYGYYSKDPAEGILDNNRVSSYEVHDALTQKLLMSFTYSANGVSSPDLKGSETMCSAFLKDLRTGKKPEGTETFAYFNKEQTNLIVGGFSDAGRKFSAAAFENVPLTLK